MPKTKPGTSAIAPGQYNAVISKVTVGQKNEQAAKYLRVIFAIQTGENFSEIFYAKMQSQL
jgi:hypothetical protein